MRLRISVDLLQDIAGKRDVYSNNFGRLGFYGDQDGNARSIVWVGHNFFKAKSFGNSLSILNQPLDMKGESFFSHGSSIIQSGACSGNTRKIWKRYAEVAICFLMDKTNILTHGSYL